MRLIEFDDFAATVDANVSARVYVCLTGDTNKCERINILVCSQVEMQFSVKQILLACTLCGYAQCTHTYAANIKYISNPNTVEMRTHFNRAKNEMPNHKMHVIQFYCC